MSEFLSELGGITGGVASEGLAFAVGFAAGRALTPAGVTIEQDAWNAATVKRLDALIAAAVAAEQYALKDTMANEASYSGYERSRFDLLYDITVTAPGTGELLQMLRRNDEAPIDFEHGLRKAKLETQWDAAITNLQWVRIPGADLAYMVVRGVVPDGGTLASSLPTQADNLKLPPQLTIDTLAEAAKTGWDPERFGALVARSGLAMGPVMAANAYFRKILTLNDYYLTIARGDLFPAFADPVLEASRQILTANQYAELRLRGWFDTDQEMYDATAKHGMSQEDTDLLFKVLGRPMTARQVFRAQRMGGVYDGPTDQIDPAFLKSLQEGNQRPEWYNLEWAFRFTQPSVFVIRQWLKDGGDPAWAQTKLLYLGWEQSDIDKFVGEYAPSATAKPAVTTASAVSGAAKAVGSAYYGVNITKAKAEADLTELGIDATAQAPLFAAWDVRREAKLQSLSNTQIRNAYRKTAITEDEGLALLEAHSMTAADALAYLTA